MLKEKGPCCFKTYADVSRETGRQFSMFHTNARVVLCWRGFHTTMSTPIPSRRRRGDEPSAPTKACEAAVIDSDVVIWAIAPQQRCLDSRNQGSRCLPSVTQVVPLRSPIRQGAGSVMFHVKRHYSDATSEAEAEVHPQGQLLDVALHLCRQPLKPK